jgi:hypothetical protein
MSVAYIPFAQREKLKSADPPCDNCDICDKTSQSVDTKGDTHQRRPATILRQSCDSCDKTPSKAHSEGGAPQKSDFSHSDYEVLFDALTEADGWDWSEAESLAQDPSTLPLSEQLIAYSRKLGAWIDNPTGATPATWPHAHAEDPRCHAAAWAVWWRTFTRERDRRDGTDTKMKEALRHEIDRDL